MNEAEDRQIIIAIPKPRTYAKSSVYAAKKKSTRTYEKLIRKPSDASLGKFKPHNSKSVSVRTIKKEELLLPYKFYEKKQEKRNRLRLTIDLNDKYKIANAKLGNRLHIDEPADDTHTITEVDQDFYKCVEGHQLSTYAPLFKSLKHLFNQYIRLRQEIGYINDFTLNIETIQRKEKETYDYSVKRYMEQVKYLDEFISLDYKKSIACLNECDLLANRLHQKELELQNLATVKFTMVSRLIGLDYLYGVQQKYGRFLYYLSPPSWRIKHRDFARSVEIEARGFDFSCSSEEDTFNVIFEKMKQECYSGLVKPVLCFKHPQDVMDIFGGIEKQQLYHFSHITHMAPQTLSLKKDIKSFRDKIEQESAVVLNIIKNYNRSLQFYEEICSDLKAKFFKVLNGTFYETVAATDVLKLKLHLEFGYERVYFEKPFKMDVITTAKALENMYMDYSMRLDAVHNEKVKLAVVHYMEKERRKTKKSKIAARELRLFNRLEQALLRAHKSIDKKPVNTIDKLVSKSNVQGKKIGRHYSKPKISKGELRVLTEAEREYLSLFTDWTENDDPAEYLQSFSITRKGNEAEGAEQL